MLSKYEKASGAKPYRNFNISDEVSTKLDINSGPPIKSFWMVYWNIGHI